MEILASKNYLYQWIWIILCFLEGEHPGGNNINYLFAHPKTFILDNRN